MDKLNKNIQIQTLKITIKRYIQKIKYKFLLIKNINNIIMIIVY